MSTKVKNIISKIVRSGKFRVAMGMVFLIFLWWIAALIVDHSIILPSPWQALSEVPTVISDALFLNRVGATLLRTLMGFSVSMIMGAFAAFLSVKKGVEDALKPVISFLRAVPTLVLTVLFYVWLGRDFAPVIIGMMMTFPIVYTGLLTALKNMDKNLLEMAAIYMIPKNKVINTIYYRSVLPYIFSTAETSLGMSFKVVLSAEVLVAPVMSIGRVIKEIQLDFFRTPEVFAWIIIVLAVTFLLEGLIGLLKRIFIRW